MDVSSPSHVSPSQQRLLNPHLQFGTNYNDLSPEERARAVADRPMPTPTRPDSMFTTPPASPGFILQLNAAASGPRSATKQSPYVQRVREEMNASGKVLNPHLVYATHQYNSPNPRNSQ